MDFCHCRPGRVQQRVLDLFLNSDMLGVNQQYNKGFAGDRMWTAPYGQEVWVSPILAVIYRLLVPYHVMVYYLLLQSKLLNQSFSSSFYPRPALKEVLS